MANKKFNNKRKSNSRSNRAEMEAETSTSNFSRGGTKRSNTRKSPTNDVSWYAENSQLLQDSASLSYSWPTGNKINYGIKDEWGDRTVSGNLKGQKAIPGIMAYSVIPGIGYSDSNVSPINIAANNVYSYVRHANSGHSNYDSPDLMMYLVAMDSAYYMLSYMQRAYGALRLYAQQNRYYARALISAMCLDYDDLIINMANFRAFLNSTAVRVGSMVVPSNMSYYKRHAQLFSGIYVDGNTPKAQIYINNPHGYYVYDETGSEKGGQLLYNELLPITRTSGSATRGYTKEGLKFSELVTIMNSILDPIIASEDLNIMSGDILKAYGEGGVVKVNTVPEDYVIMPSYDYNILQQFKHATVWDESLPNLNYVSGSLNITQDPDTNAIIYKPTLASADTQHYNRRIISTINAQVTPADTMEYTRLCSMSDGADLRYIGSEFVHQAEVWYYNTDHEGNWNLLFNIFGTNSGLYTAGISAEVLRVYINNLTDISKFAYHPAILCYVYGQDAVFYEDLLFDVDNYAVISSHELEKMHTTALFSEFNCPQMGRVN